VEAMCCGCHVEVLYIHCVVGVGVGDLMVLGRLGGLVVGSLRKS
jgi:hypothetical protein